MIANQPEVWLIRHGETQWSLSGAHTGKTEIPLTTKGEESAAAIGEYLKNRVFSLALTSPRLRARETCRLAGFADQAIINEDLSEWDYGIFEGCTTAEIRERIHGWAIWDGPVPGGETIEEVATRAARIISIILTATGPIALFSHGHILRILTALWLELPPQTGRRWELASGTVSTLGYEHETRVITSWGRAF
jgi:broad specificity phosphatase PhoE